MPILLLTFQPRTFARMSAWPSIDHPPEPTEDSNLPTPILLLTSRLHYSEPGASWPSLDSVADSTRVDVDRADALEPNNIDGAPNLRLTRRSRLFHPRTAWPRFEDAPVDEVIVDAGTENKNHEISDETLKILTITTKPSDDDRAVSRSVPKSAVAWRPRVSAGSLATAVLAGLITVIVVDPSIDSVVPTKASVETDSIQSFSPFANFNTSSTGGGSIATERETARPPVFFAFRDSEAQGPPKPDAATVPTLYGWFLARNDEKSATPTATLVRAGSRPVEGIKSKGGKVRVSLRRKYVTLKARKKSPAHARRSKRR